MYHQEGSYIFFDRDLSWLSFNERVLMEAEKATVPLMERVNFLSIYSSNLDEFYRVRMPVIIQDGASRPADEVNQVIAGQLDRFGKVLREIIPELALHNIHLLYNIPLPSSILAEVTHYFYAQVLSFLTPVYLSGETKAFFPVNNHLYLAVFIESGEGHEIVIINIPSQLPRFFTVSRNDEQYVVFLEDIIRAHLPAIFRTSRIAASYNFKVTRNSALSFDDESEAEPYELIERQIEQREFGNATRFLYDFALPATFLERLVGKLGLNDAVLVAGGPYHNLKDLSSMPVALPELRYPRHHAAQSGGYEYLLNYISSRDLLLHTPYHSYDTVLRFFNEAAIDRDVTEISTSIYRVATESRIVNALISARKNGKRVRVIVELKARFDEANNLGWAKKLTAAGVEVSYSAAALKIHAKIALVRRRGSAGTESVGLLATGNLNESTSRFYTDHILLTSRKAICEELETLFSVLNGEPETTGSILFTHLLVSQYNLLDRFTGLIDREIANAGLGRPAAITIKLNNLEERVLIARLYEASCAGVQVHLIVRSICCLVPGVPGMSENISVTRIVDRFLEHGRVFIFHNAGNEEVYLGSADWMNRNIYRRIEVCFPVYDPADKAALIHILGLQINDLQQGVMIDNHLRNIVCDASPETVGSQTAIARYLVSVPGREP